MFEQLGDDFLFTTWQAYLDGRCYSKQISHNSQLMYA